MMRNLTLHEKISIKGLLKERGVDWFADAIELEPNSTKLKIKFIPLATLDMKQAVCSWKYTFFRSIGEWYKAKFFSGTTDPELYRACKGYSYKRRKTRK